MYVVHHIDGDAEILAPEDSVPQMVKKWPMDHLGAASIVAPGAS